MFVGINSFFEHPSVAMVQDGKVSFAAEEERFTGIKHGRRYNPYVPYLPIQSLYRGLRHIGATSSDIREIAYSYSGKLHARSLVGCLTGARFSPLSEEWSALQSLRKLRLSLAEGHDIPHFMRHVLNPSDFKRVPFVEWPHHDSHAASAYLCSGFAESLVVVSDGAGEYACTSVYIGRDGKLRRIAVTKLPHSLGHFYSTVTRYLGFEPFSDEFKMMGLSGFGKDQHRGLFERLVELLPQGQYRINVKMLKNISEHLPPGRTPLEELTQAHCDVAKSAQIRLEDALVHIVRHHVSATGLRNLCMAGGTFLNCIANGRLANLQLFDRIFAQPASSDAGTAIGAAALSSGRHGERLLSCESFGLGTSYSDDQLSSVLRDAGLQGEKLSEAELLKRTASGLAKGQVFAIFRGRMEFGPRALGMRSLLASPCFKDMQTRLNLIKGRESFRPVAPIVASEHFKEYFEGHPDPYMLFASRVRDDQRERIPSAVHVDGTARVQSVGPEHDKFLHALLMRFSDVAGVPVLINTSFNVRGKPIIESPVDALACYCTSRVDALIFGSFLLEKKWPQFHPI